MTYPPLSTLPPDADAHTAADMMSRQRIHRVLVTEGDKLVGIVSALDVAQAVADHRLTERTFVFNRDREFRAETTTVRESLTKIQGSSGSSRLLDRLILVPVFTRRESVDRCFPRDVAGKRASWQFGANTRVVRWLDTTKASRPRGT